jgi:hypothetical protein
MDLIPNSKTPPPTDGSTFLSYNRNQNSFQITWFDRVHRSFKYTGGDYYGTEQSPKFTHWCQLPAIFEIAPTL